MLHLQLKQTPHNEKVKNKLLKQCCCFTKFKTSQNSDLTLIWSQNPSWVKINVDNKKVPWFPFHLLSQHLRKCFFNLDKWSFPEVCQGRTLALDKPGVNVVKLSSSSLEI
jgi:hypothetical protein